MLEEGLLIVTSPQSSVTGMSKTVGIESGLQPRSRFSHLISGGVVSSIQWYILVSIYLSRLHRVMRYFRNREYKQPSFSLSSPNHLTRASQWSGSKSPGSGMALVRSGLQPRSKYIVWSARAGTGS